MNYLNVEKKLSEDMRARLTNYLETYLEIPNSEYIPSTTVLKTSAIYQGINYLLKCRVFKNPDEIKEDFLKMQNGILPDFLFERYKRR